MRRVRLSKAFLLKLQDLLTFGADRFGTKVAADKRALVDQMIFSTLERHPGIGSLDEVLGVYTMRKSVV